MLLLDPKTLEPATEQRIILYDVTWEKYEQLSDMFVDEFPRMTYLEGTLEIIMTTSPEHERLKTIIARLIETQTVTFVWFRTPSHNFAAKCSTSVTVEIN